MGRIAFLLLALLTPALTACASGATSAPGPTLTPAPTSPPATTAPPAAALVYGITPVVGEAGTRCWDRVCIDFVGPVTPELPLVVDAARPFTLSFAAGDPDEVALSWYAALVPMPVAANGQRSWSIDPRSASRATALVMPAEPGQYIFSVFARWDGLGDVTYSWLIDVR
ncbi:MAG: hypothetical protein AB7T37_18035 [Dehalococcoidia bacterium]